MKTNELEALVKGVLCNYLGKALSKARMEKATGELVNLLLDKLNEEQPQPEPETKPEKPKKKRTLTKDEKARVKMAKDTKFKGIVSTPDVMEDGDAGPVTYLDKK